MNEMSRANSVPETQAASNSVNYAGPMNAVNVPTASLRQPIERPKFSIERKDVIYAVLSAVLCIFSVATVSENGFYAGFTACYLAFFALVTSYCVNKQTRLRPYSLLCGILSVTSSLTFSVSDSFSVKFRTIAVLFLTSAIWFDSLNGGRSERGELSVIGNVFKTTFGHSCKYLSCSMRSLFAPKRVISGTALKVIVGVACALPVALVVVPLLISSDAAFDGLVSSFAADMSSVPLYVFLGLAITPFLISYCYSLKKVARVESNKSKFAGIADAYIVAFLSVVAVIYLVYLFSQLAYFFSAFSGILPVGYEFSVAEYARRGFFEMCTISAINFVLIFGSILLSRKVNDKPSMAVRLLCTFIGVFTAALSVTAISKMILYIGCFGMTFLRIATSAFLVFLFIVSAILVVKCFAPKLHVVRTAIAAAACILIVLGFADVDRVVAEYNTAAYLNGALKTVDVSTVIGTSEAGIPSLVRLATDSRSEVSTEAKAALDDAVEYMYNVEYDSDGNAVYRRNATMGSWSLSAKRAYDALDKYIDNNRSNR